MYLKKLEMVGFKSFCNKTVLDFEPGITAVVGPNGTGKSNIFDAIRWVLGEQSIKSLRGSDMQDVIFNGSDSKEPLSMAEVTLTFDNSKRFFNFDHEEVAITRRIFRSGESEYLLNKNLVRLKDILDLLLGTGIGAESYSLVAQGKIDLVLSSRPEDRRLVFDEAAGITKYKAQKRETMRRLEETEQNLLRVNDIITEVKRQIGSLERQANKARKYKEAFEELKLKEINLAAIQKTELLKEKDQVIQELSSLEKEERGLLETIKEEELKMSLRQQELKAYEEAVMALKNEILNLENSVVRNNERATFNEEKIKELSLEKINLELQLEQLKARLLLDEDKLTKLKEEYANIENNIAQRNVLLKTKEDELGAMNSSIKLSLEAISGAKQQILELVAKIAGVKNEITDALAKEQVFLARKRRLELEKAKVSEEKNVVGENLKNITLELENLIKTITDLGLNISWLKNELTQGISDLSNINTHIDTLDKKRLGLESHKAFIEKLRTKYEDIGEALKATVYLDKLPAERLTGLVVKIKDYQEGELKLSGEAKPIGLDTQKIDAEITKIQQDLDTLNNKKIFKEGQISKLNKATQSQEEELRSQDIALANKRTSHEAVLGEFNKIKEEEGVINLEYEEVLEEIVGLQGKIATLKASQSELELAQKRDEEILSREQANIDTNSSLKEAALVVVAQLKVEVESSTKRISSDQATLNLLESAYKQDKDSLFNIQKQKEDNEDKSKGLKLEIDSCLSQISQDTALIKAKKEALIDKDREYRNISEGSTEMIKHIEDGRKRIDLLKKRLYDLQMHNKDLDFKLLGMRERLMQAYKVNLDTIENTSGVLELNMLTEEIQRLKEKVDSYGTVNLVAIEEYDELKQRYDFLIQQQTDLVSAKDSLHEAILKINRTTKQMFLETFEKVRLEFRNYFRMLFNGGDAQVFLIDEHDPLDSGIEIICRPPGKKLQNVLLLSGGEKALSAIALIFAIFKVKPSPFCVLDEIDAALDEANVDRFSQVLQEFAKGSQFVVITHNKRTIANADVMYGITMEEMGVSKIVSVKFAQTKPVRDKESEAVAEPA
jgi:chromosome segregation protein